jgi:hypothetical protein
MDVVVEGLALKLGITRTSPSVAKVLLGTVMVQNRSSFQKNIIFFGDLRELTKRHPSSGIPSVK